LLVARVDEITEPFRGDRSFELQRVLVRRHLASAVAGASDPKRAHGLAAQIDRIATPFPSDRDFQIERARALRYVVRSYRNGTGDISREARSVVDRLEAVSRPFDGDREFALERVRGWEELTGVIALLRGHARTFEAAEEAAQRVDGIAAPFSGDRDFEMIRADAWANAVVSLSRTPPVDVGRTLDRVDEITAPFADSPDFVVARVRAWRITAHSFQFHGSDAESWRKVVEIAERVDKLAADFPDHRGLQLHRASTWLAAFETTRGAGATAAAREAGARVERLANRFLGDSEFDELRSSLHSSDLDE
jgi:hypothetical protein